MDETVGVGVGPAERAHHAGGDGPTPEPRRRMSARRKQETVLRLLRGEDLELVSRELGVTAAELSGWRDQFLAGGEASLKSRPADARDAEIDRLQAKVGELTMTAELLEAKIERLEAHCPLARRRPRSRPPPAISMASSGSAASGACHGPPFTDTVIARRRPSAGGPGRKARWRTKAWWRQSDSCSKTAPFMVRATASCGPGYALPASAPAGAASCG